MTGKVRKYHNQYKSTGNNDTNERVNETGTEDDEEKDTDASVVVDETSSRISE